MAGDDWGNLPERFTLASIYHDVARVIGWNAAVSFGMNVWREKRPPSRVRGNGWGVVYVPSRLDDRFGLELIRLTGERNAAALVKEFSGQCLEFPNIVPASINRRNRAIIQHLRDGLRPAVVACAFGITDRQVRRIASMESSACPAAKR